MNPQPPRLWDKEKARQKLEREIKQRNDRYFQPTHEVRE
jgi:hypothetical protein